jgi:cyclin-dependent kinase 7
MMMTEERYTKDEKIGEGTYAVVYKGTDKETSQRVAIKKLRMGHQREGIHFSAIREIKFLQEFHHTNIIQVSCNICCILVNRRFIDMF